MRWLLLIFCLFVPLSAVAQNNIQAIPAPTISGDFKDLKHTSSGRIDKIIDGSTILMKDGKIIHLLSLFYPVTTGEAADGSTVDAKLRLEALLKEGTEVMLYQPRNQKTGRINRMGHTLAHLVNKQTGQWINGTIIADGLAYAITDQSNPELADQLYALENKARTQKIGIWKDGSPHLLLTSDNAGQGNGMFRIVEGRVNRSATAQNNLYLNFGTDWRKDFTVQITPDIRKTLARRGIDPMNLTGKHIRVRGWIREWNGPFIELETPDRIEILPTSGQPTP
jgi:micrococcal nuclease